MNTVISSYPYTCIIHGINFVLFIADPYYVQDCMNELPQNINTVILNFVSCCVRYLCLNFLFLRSLCVCTGYVLVATPNGPLGTETQAKVDSVKYSQIIGQTDTSTNLVLFARKLLFLFIHMERFACLAQSHYLNQSWLTVNWTFGNTLPGHPKCKIFHSWKIYLKI